MRNAALILGIIGGIVGMIVGFFSFGYTELAERFDNVVDQVENVRMIRVGSFLAPLLAIAGGAMARSRNVSAGAMMLISAAGMYYVFGFNFATMFPIGMCALGGLLALLATQPDSH
jgi:uncharacterized membrane protein